MATIRSGWAVSPPSISGTLTAAEWVGAGEVPIPAGILLVKNDKNFLYLAMDLIGDTGNTAGTGDYFWLSFDVDGNRSITPRIDVNYGIYPSLPIKIGRQYYLGAGSWTGILPDPSQSLARQGFGTSPKSGTSHRIWELRIDLKEIGVNLASASTLPSIGFGLRVSSSSPSFTYDYPANFYSNFSNLSKIVFAVGPSTVPIESGVVIGQIGVIPTGASIISGGRATTASSYSPFVQNAAFGGVMHLRGNRTTMQSLWGIGARKYVVLHKFGASGGFLPIRQSWSNYRWVGNDVVLEPFGPDSDGKYMLTDPGHDYSINDLLLQWTSNGFDPGIHEFQIQFYNTTGGKVASPVQTLQLFLDNNLPDVQILGASYQNNTILPCSIIDIAETNDPVKVHVRAFDTEGDLHSYALNAYYGNNKTFVPSLASVGYPGGNWQGDSERWIDAPVNPKFPPITCAYQLRLSAYPRVTNGYGYIGYNEATYHVTFRRPGAPSIPKLAEEFPFGFSGPNREFKPGIEPKKLGG